MTDRIPGPVVVTGDHSPWGEAALRWATEYAMATGAPLEVRPPTADPVRDLMPAGSHAGLLVVGYRGANGTAFGLGRLVSPLVEHAACDVVVVRGTAEALRRAHRRVTVLLSGDAYDDDLALARAVAYAEQQHVALRVLHATPSLPVRADDPVWPVTHADDVLRGTRHTSVLVRMHPHEAITRYADTDLLVPAGLGPVTRAALHHAPCPVLVAHRHPVDVAPPRSAEHDRAAHAVH
jgi:nucleotide-binding universal stress UspA family protein